MALMVANWKMNKTVKEAVEFVKKLKKHKLKNKAVICPSFVCLHPLKNLGIDLGALDVSAEEDGAFTGDISARMLKEVCKYVVIGHSERREYHNETNELVNKKVKIALKYNLKPILCVGETLEQKKKGLGKKIVEKQLKIGLKNIDIKKVIIAYEPVWAISGGDPSHKAATAEDAQKMHSFIRKIIVKKIPILYGGSMKPENVKELMKQKDIDGGLIGTASLKLERFLKTVNY